MATERITPEAVKRELDTAILQAVNNNNREFGPGECCFNRDRILTAEKMVKILLSMQGGSLAKELHDLGVNVTKSAFVQRRDKISYTVLEEVLDNFNAFQKEFKTFKGYRILAVDGTTINMARDTEAPSYVQTSSNKKGYNQMHVTPLFDVLNNIYLHCVIQPQPKQDEIGALLFMLEWYDLEDKTLIVADRGFESYYLFAKLMEKNKTDFLIRIKQDRSAMREVRKLPMKELDTEISFTITTTQTKKDKENNYIFQQTQKNKNRIYSSKTKAGRWDLPSLYPMKFRVVRFLLDTGEYETLATSLPQSVTLAEIKELYHSRWRIETAFRELKYNLGLINLHSRKDSFVNQEILSAMIMSNFAFRIAGQAIIESQKKNKYIYKINMKMAVYLCREFYRRKKGNGKQLMQDIQKYTEPVRPGRKNERDIKAKSFTGFTYRVFS